MKTKFLTFPFEIKGVDEDDKGKISGYASTFGNIDLGLDIVDNGAFKKTLHENKGKFPVLADHDPRKQIGWNVSAKEDSIGLMTKGELDIDVNTLAKERFSLAKKGLELGVKVGLSIGYFPIKTEPDRDRPAVTRLKELKLFEYSLVPFPMNTDAMVTGVKNFELMQDIDTEILAEIKILINNGKCKEFIIETLQGAVNIERESDEKLIHSINNLKSIFNNN